MRKGGGTPGGLCGVPSCRILGPSQGPEGGCPVGRKEDWSADYPRPWPPENRGVGIASGFVQSESEGERTAGGPTRGTALQAEEVGDCP